MNKTIIVLCLLQSSYSYTMLHTPKSCQKLVMQQHALHKCIPNSFHLLSRQCNNNTTSCAFTAKSLRQKYEEEKNKYQAAKIDHLTGATILAGGSGLTGILSYKLIDLQLNTGIDPMILFPSFLLGTASVFFAGGCVMNLAQGYENSKLYKMYKDLYLSELKKEIAQQK